MHPHNLKKNNVQIKGKGSKTIIFGHGFGCDQLVWSKVSPLFESEFQVVLFDYIGSGNSDKSYYSKERYSSLMGYKQDLLDICDDLELERIYFVGHSVSGMVGLLASIERPELFEKLVMIGPSPCYLNESGYIGGFEKSDIDDLLDMMEINYKEWAKYMAPVVMQNEDRPHLASEFEQILGSNDPMIARQFAEVTFSSDVRHKLPDVSVPVLILQPQHDAIVPVEVGDYLQRNIKGSELQLMKAMGHNPHISDPTETVDLIKKYLAT